MLLSSSSSCGRGLQCCFAHTREHTCLSPARSLISQANSDFVGQLSGNPSGPLRPLITHTCLPPLLDPNTRALFPSFAATHPPPAVYASGRARARGIRLLHSGLLAADHQVSGKPNQNAYPPSHSTAMPADPSWQSTRMHAGHDWRAHSRPDLVACRRVGPSSRSRACRESRSQQQEDVRRAANTTSCCCRLSTLGWSGWELAGWRGRAPSQPMRGRNGDGDFVIGGRGMDFAEKVPADQRNSISSTGERHAKSSRHRSFVWAVKSSSVQRTGGTRFGKYSIPVPIHPWAAGNLFSPLPLIPGPAIAARCLSAAKCHPAASSMDQCHG